MHPEARELKVGTPLRDVLEYANGLTRKRNELNFRSVADRIDHLTLGGGELLKAVHANDVAILPRIAAKVMLRIFTVLQGFEEKDAIIQKLMEKFPAGACSYCGKKPCQCEVDRSSAHASVAPSEVQKNWSLRQWQDHLKEMYGGNNHAKGGLLWTVSRLVGEIKEVLEARMRMDRESSLENIETYKQEAMNELADAFAWVIAVCNELGVDLEEVFVKKYGKGCEHCGKYPCACGAFDWKDERSQRSV